MKKILLSLAVTGCCILDGHSASHLQLTMADGATPVFALAEKPSVTFDGAKMNIATPSTKLSYDRSDIVKLHFVDITTAMAAIEVDADPAAVYNGDTVTLPGACIEVYDLNGALRASGRDTLSLSALATGVYVVRAGGSSFMLVRN